MLGNRVVAMSTTPMSSVLVNPAGFQSYSSPNGHVAALAALQKQLPLGYMHDHQDYADHRKKWAWAAHSGLPPVPQAGINRFLGPAPHSLPPISFMAIVVVRDMKRK
jgi:hypothetical protein